jgi:hypothetical protein
VQRSSSGFDVCGESFLLSKTDLHADYCQSIKQADAANKLCIVLDEYSALQLACKFPLVRQRAFAGNHFKIFMKTGEVIKAAFVAEPL